MRISIFFGGHDEEKGISINSARAAFEMIKKIDVEIYLYYVDSNFSVYSVPLKNIYSNTPDDFIFAINKIENFWSNFSTDFAIPLIHGKIGEDGQLQQKLEEKKIPFLFSSSRYIRSMFLKSTFCQTLWAEGFPQWGALNYIGDELSLKNFHRQFKEIILKPDDGGSSRNVFVSKSYKKSLDIIKKNKNLCFLAEEKHKGREFSVAVLNGQTQIPVEIDTRGKIFDHRSKYFPTDGVLLMSPPTFAPEIIHQIQKDCAKIYKIMQAEDAIRIDGWLLTDNRLIYTECNPIPSIEFNGIFFQSTIQTPHNLFLNLLNTKLSRLGMSTLMQSIQNKEELPILFGGNSPEKHVSLLSGQNVCTKFTNSSKFYPIPFFWHKNHVYELPICLIFKHTCKDLLYSISNLTLLNKLTGFNLSLKKMSLSNFISKHSNKKIFLALHGGEGENGEIQRLLEAKNIKFNGSSSTVSALCMDKFQTIQIVEKKVPILKKIQRYLIDLNLPIIPKTNRPFIIKPNNDGCSNGVVIPESTEDLHRYISSIKQEKKHMSINGVKLIVPKRQNLLFEEFISTDKVVIRYASTGYDIFIEKHTGWVELTIGVCRGEVFPASLTVSSGEFLTSEEKFQEGYGINLTPPPEKIITKQQLQIINKVIKQILQAINLTTYARLDIFFNRFSNECILIEVNTLPALTFSTVLFQQTSVSGLDSVEFLESLMY